MDNALEKLYTRLDRYRDGETLPVLFVGHGNPLNVINHSSYATVWQELGKHIPKPRAIVCMSAHWLTDGTYVSAIESPELIYDFYGFPPELYQVEYPTKGSVEVAYEIQKVVPEIMFDEARGLDHGVWTVLKHLFPLADVPVLQLSIDFEHSRQVQCDLMEKLRPLRKGGILFIGSGNIVHNLGMMRMSGTYEWAETFDALSEKLIEEKDLKTLIAIEAESNDASLAIPMDDHYRPMLNALALVQEHETITFFNESIDLGAVSMRSFVAL
jgi:4,5-DOPA dioxygenase extradiol